MDGSDKVPRRFWIDVLNPGGHICNPLLCLSGADYDTRDEACDAIYAALFDIIDSDDGCEMVYGVKRHTDEYHALCLTYIKLHGLAMEDGVTAVIMDREDGRK